VLQVPSTGPTQDRRHVPLRTTRTPLPQGRRHVHLPTTRTPLLRGRHGLVPLTGVRGFATVRVNNIHTLSYEFMRFFSAGYGAGTTPEDSYGAAQAPPSPQGVAEQMAQSLFASPTQEELGYSQLHDAPPRATQQSEDQEAVHDSPPPRRTRQPRDPFSHGSRHTWAAQRAARRSKRGRS